jgi:hypothetical protein
VTWGGWSVTSCAAGRPYGLIERRLDPGDPRLRGRRVALSGADRTLFGGVGGRSVSAASYVFDAQLVGVGGVRARVAVRADQHLTALHDAIEEAFGWWDDHLYSFWLDGRFWGDPEAEYTSPVTPDHGVRTADVPLEELDLSPGATLAYVFDFGDEWRVRLTLRAIADAEDGPYPRVLHRTGQAPPQYDALDDEE